MTDDELMTYMRSAEFKRRAKRLQRRIIKRGGQFTFDEIARELKLPLDVCIGGFQYSVAKAFGHMIVPVERSQ